MTVREKVYVLAISAIGYCTLLWALTQWPAGAPIRFLSLLAVSVLASASGVKLPGLANGLSVRFFILLICVALLSWPETVTIACVCAILESLVWRRPASSPAAAAFYVAVAVIATSASYAAYRIPAAGAAGMPSPLLMVLAACVYFVASTVPVAIYAAQRVGKSAASMWKGSFFWTFPHYVAGGSAAGLLAIADRHNGWEVTLLIVPMLCWMVHAYRLYLERADRERRSVEELGALQLRTIEALAVAIEGRDPEQRGHKRGVCAQAVEIGRQMDLPDRELQALRIAALLRDVGTLAVPEHILSKPGRLSKAEFEKMKVHPVAGAEIVEQAGFPYPVAPIVRSHHEKWDGTGYPAGLRGEQIPIGARILAVVDSLNALVSERSYRRTYTVEEAVEYVKSESGKSFDPAVVEIVAGRYRNFERTSAEGGQSPDSSSGFVSPIVAARQEVQELFALTQELGNSLSLDETFSVLSLRIKRLCPHDTLVVYIRREDHLDADYATGLDCHLVGSGAVQWGEGICGRAAAFASPVLNGDLPEDRTQNAEGSPRLRSALAVPLEGFSGVVGVLCLYARQKNAFTEDHLRILSAVTTKLAVSVENALKYRQAERSAVTDMLTELPNARSLFLYLDAELSRARREAHSITVMVCDLDGFKQINDRFGHLEGNRVLRAVARSLRMHCREYDCVARLGGDEFVVVMPGHQAESVDAKVEQLSSAVTQAGYDTVGEGYLGISVGVAHYPEDGEDAESLLAAADQRMYREKHRPGAPARGSDGSEVLV